MEWKVEGKTEFNGETYVLLGKYFRRFKRKDGVDYLHRKVWEFHNCEIPDGYDVHHKDRDTLNNDISNLELITKEDHIQEHIETRRKIGLAHVKSGHLDKIREMTKEWHASEEGLKWHSEHAKETFNRDNYDKVIKKCDQCDKEYEISVLDSHNSRFCSNNCKSAWRRASGIDNITRFCVICDSEFITSRYNKKKFCSRKCSGINTRKRNGNL